MATTKKQTKKEEEAVVKYVDVDEYMKHVMATNGNVSRLDKLDKEVKDLHERMANVLEDTCFLIDAIRRYNKKPWYKRMFAKII